MSVGLHPLGSSEQHSQINAQQPAKLQNRRIKKAPEGAFFINVSKVRTSTEFQHRSSVDDLQYQMTSRLVHTQG